MAVGTKNEIKADEVSKSLLKQANDALRDCEYKHAIELYKMVSKRTPALSKIAQFNIELATRRLKSLAKDSESIFSLDPAGDKCKGLSVSNIQMSKLPKGDKNKSQAMLRLDGVSSHFAQGWALDKEFPDNTVVLRVDLDHKPYSIVETHLQRDDVKKAFGGDGFSGYRAELNSYASYSSKSSISVTPLSHIANANELHAAKKAFQPIMRGVHYKDINKAACSVVQENIVNTNKNKKYVKVSIVILNLNGEDVLKECVSSILKYNEEAEIIVVDHASTDGSVEMLHNFKSNRIKVIQRDKNYSYSESNNLGAKEAKGDVIVFLNNDIILTSDSITEMANVVIDGEFGLLGIKLWDLPRNNDFSLGESVKVEQHLAVHFKGLNRNETIEAFEVRNNSFIDLDSGLLETPAVTAAMLTISKEDFNTLGGFSEKYFYGQEDVDFCLRFYREIEKKIGVLLDHGAYHIRGLSRKSLSKNNKSYIENNRKVIQQELAPWFRKEFRIGQFERPGFWNQKPLSIAMVVSEIGFDTDKADFFTAKEFGDAFETDNKTVVGYFDTDSDYDVLGYDIVIVYVDGFDPRRLKNVSPHCVVIGWARNWFDRWCDRPWIEHYDILYASSELAQKYMSERLKRHVGLLRIAASNECLKPLAPNKEYESDYVFTGSYFDSPREITEALKPNEVPFSFKLFGHNWEKLPHFGKFSCGPVPYTDIPSVYASTRLVIDDANIATKKWGAINCRVYDSLAAGILCVTNNEIGVKEIFGADFPTYSGDGVNKQITSLLKDNARLSLLAEKYKNIVRREHTYLKRSAQLLNDVMSYTKKKKIAIKIAAPDFERGISWGDYHFAAAVREEFENLGYAVRIDCMDQWYGDRRLNDDINLVLRGLDRFRVRKDQLNILWMISHPDLVCEAELRDFDQIYVASELYAEKLRAFTNMDNIDVLLQASSFKIDKLDPEVLEQTPEHDILFIGNSRNEYRDVVRWCIEEDLPISVYGGGWEQFIPRQYIKGQFLDNSLVPYYYKKAKVVLNDHWEDMRRNGFISNRVFDVVSVRGSILTDKVYGIESLKCDQFVNVYKNKDDFLEKIISLLEKNMDMPKFSDNTSVSFADRVIKVISDVKI